MAAWRRRARFIERWWADVRRCSAPTCRDAKTRLQEWAQARGQRRGRAGLYAERTEGPDHAPRFVVEAKVTGFDPALGEGGSKRQAEQDAAAKLLAMVGTHMTQRCGFCRHHRRAQCGQIHPGQRAGGHRRSPSSAPRCRPRACRCAASPWRARPRSSSWIRPASSGRAGGWTAPWSSSAWAGAEEADAVLLIVDAADLVADKSPAARDTDAILEGLKDRKGKKTALVLNKIDGMKRTDLLPLVEKFHAEGVFEDVFLISALKGEAVADVAAWVAARMPEGPWLYPEDQAADIPSRLLAAEVTREKIYLRLHDELPYAIGGGNREMGRAQGRLGQDRPGDLCPARRPEGDRAGQGRRDHQEDRRTGARPNWKNCSAGACTCSCSSKCAKTGPRTASTIRKSGSDLLPASRRHGMA